MCMVAALSSVVHGLARTLHVSTHDAMVCKYIMMYSVDNGLASFPGSWSVYNERSVCQITVVWLTRGKPRRHIEFGTWRTSPLRHWHTCMAPVHSCRHVRAHLAMQPLVHVTIGYCDLWILDHATILSCYCFGT